MSTRIFRSPAITLLFVALAGAQIVGVAGPGMSTGALAAEPPSDPILAPLTRPELLPEAGWSWKALDADFVDSTIADVVSEFHIPGAAVSVVKNGEVAWTATYGEADTELGIPVTESTALGRR